MRGRLYPRPRERYERFRLNPYSPLYEGLAIFVSAPSVESVRPELHGPYALPGAAYSCGAAVFHRFFPEIGRAAIATSQQGYPIIWPIVIPPQEVITLTAVINAAAPTFGKFVMLINAGGYRTANMGDYSDGTWLLYGWRNDDGTSGGGRSEVNRPLNMWFTLSVTFRPGSVTAYLSTRGIIPVPLYGGVWPTRLAESRQIWISEGRNPPFVADAFVHLRELSLTELHAISDYGNVDLRVPGEAPLILPVRTYWPSVLPVAPSYLKRRSLGARVGTREAAL
jgi:hypothetical protein